MVFKAVGHMGFPSAKTGAQLQQALLSDGLKLGWGDLQGDV